MANSGTALGIIGIILAAGAIGFAFFVWNGQNATNSDLKTDLGDLTDELNNLTSEYNNLQSEFDSLETSIVVGIWDEVDENTDYTPFVSDSNWLFEFSGNNVSNPEYISTSNGGTRITLLKEGWYRVHLCVLLLSINPTSTYWTKIYKDGDFHLYLDRYGTSSTVDSMWYSINSYAFVYSNSTNYIEINPYSSTDDFYVSTLQSFNQFSIEYVVV